MFDFLAEIFYPKRCIGCRRPGSYICSDDLAKISFLEFQLCGVCQKGSIDGMTHPGCATPQSIDGILSSIGYRGIVKKLLYQFKYKPFLSDLKIPLGKLFYEGLIQQEAFVKFVGKNPILIAVPLHSQREKSRGYNQSELLAKQLSVHLGIKYLPNVLRRKINTKAQFSLKKEERRVNLKGAFDFNLKFKESLIGKRIILVDDITTTGSTLRECTKILKRGGVGAVLGVTLAHEG